jgi:hypothetical protein
VIVLINSRINIPIPPKLNWHKIFFACMYTQIMAPHKILVFSDLFNIIIFSSVLNETKEGHLHVGHTRILHPHGPKIGP